jgi:hypothetical protein
MPYTFVNDFGSFKKGQQVADVSVEAITSGAAVRVAAPATKPVAASVAQAEKLDVSHLDGAQLRSGDFNSKVG